MRVDDPVVISCDRFAGGAKDVLQTVSYRPEILDMKSVQVVRRCHGEDLRDSQPPERAQ